MAVARINMKPIPKEIRMQLSEEIEKSVCARRYDGECNGRLTVEHVFGRTKQPRWTLIFLCWYHHLGGGLDKKKNRHFAYQQATDQMIKATFPKNWQEKLQDKRWLEQKYKYLL